MQSLTDSTSTKMVQCRGDVVGIFHSDWNTFRENFRQRLPGGAGDAGDQGDGGRGEGHLPVR